MRPPPRARARPRFKAADRRNATTRRVTTRRRWRGGGASQAGPRQCGSDLAEIRAQDAGGAELPAGALSIPERPRTAPARATRARPLEGQQSSKPRHVSWVAEYWLAEAGRASNRHTIALTSRAARSMRRHAVVMALLSLRASALVPRCGRAAGKRRTLEGKRRLLEDEKDADPAASFDPLQWAQAGATLLAREFEAVSVLIGDDFAALPTLAEARASPIHGTGLFATRDLPMNTLVTLYRPDLTVDDAGKALTIEQGDAEYFQSPSSREPGNRASAPASEAGGGSRPRRGHDVDRGSRPTQVLGLAASAQDVRRPRRRPAAFLDRVQSAEAARSRLARAPRQRRRRVRGRRRRREVLRRVARPLERARRAAVRAADGRRVEPGRRSGRRNFDVLRLRRVAPTTTGDVAFAVRRRAAAEERLGVPRQRPSISPGRGDAAAATRIVPTEQERA